MKISESERRISIQLIEKFLKHKDKLPYANIGASNEYIGWVHDFHVKDSRNRKIRLNLKNGNDLFLLFILAIGWSRIGPWENSAFLAAYLKIFKIDSPLFWLEEINYKGEKAIREKATKIIIAGVALYMFLD
jgi:hypothetical protein